MRPLFTEKQKSSNSEKDVLIRAIKEYGAQSINLITDDKYRISALYFERPEAPVNIIYVTGYFNEATPGKEWAAPLAGILFKEFNCLTLDWRGFGDSEGEHGLLNGLLKQPNSFGSDAYPDIQAAIDFIKTKNNKPVILVGFCGGGAMIIHHTIQAKKMGRATADGLVLNCLFTRMENMLRRGDDPADPLYVRACIKFGVAEWFMNNRMSGSLISIPPIELIKEITIPCSFEHFSGDEFAILSEGIEVYNAAPCPKMFTQSNIGRHVRIHSKAPWQYRIGFLTFLEKFNFISHDYYTKTLGVSGLDLMKSGYIDKQG